MSRLSRPLNREAVRAADKAFYSKHPELVKNGERIPLSEANPSQADLRNEWASLYAKQGGQIEEDHDTWPTKKPDEPLQACPGQEQNWLDLEYLYCDGTGVAGAYYQVTNNDGGGVVAHGTLDANGYAWCALPASVNNVSYDFDKDPPTVEYLQQPVANPEQSKIKEGWFDRMAESIAAAGSWTWGTLQGDFNEEQTVGQVATNAVITMIPLVDQVGDVRDLTANLKFLIWDKRYNDKWVWIALVLTLIGLIPVLGSAAKGVLKTVASALQSGAKVPLKLLIEVLNKFHKGNAIQWLRQLAADLPNHAVTMKRQFRVILSSLRDKLKLLAKTLPGALGKKADEAVSAIDEVAKVADGKIDEAVRELQDGLNKSLDEGVDFETKGATKSKNTRRQADAAPPDLPDRESMKKLLQEDVENALKSSDPDKVLEGQVGKAVMDDLENFNKKIGPNGSVGEIDIETSKAIIEVTSKPKGKLSQIKKLMEDRNMNPSKKPVILYAPNYKGTPAQDISNTGAIVVRSEEELLEVLSKL